MIGFLCALGQHSPGCLSASCEVSRWSQLHGAYSYSPSEAAARQHLPSASVIRQLSRFNTADYCVYVAGTSHLDSPCSLVTNTDRWHGQLHVKQVFFYPCSRTWKNTIIQLFFFFQFSFWDDEFCYTLMWFKLTVGSVVSGVSCSEPAQPSAPAL